jgi:hypothetical protein
MALLTQQAPSILGGAITYGASAASDTCFPGDGIYYHVKTGATNSAPIQIVVPGTLYGVARPDTAIVTVPINSDRIFGPLIGDLADPVTGLVTILNSGTLAGTTCAILQM